MTGEKTNQVDTQRAILSNQLISIDAAFEVIGEVMKDLPHPRGIATRAIKPNEAPYVEHKDNGEITAIYQDSIGQKYRLTRTKISH